MSEQLKAQLCREIQECTQQLNRLQKMLRILMEGSEGAGGVVIPSGVPSADKSVIIDGVPHRMQKTRHQSVEVRTRISASKKLWWENRRKMQAEAKAQAEGVGAGSAKTEEGGE